MKTTTTTAATPAPSTRASSPHLTYSPSEVKRPQTLDRQNGFLSADSGSVFDLSLIPFYDDLLDHSRPHRHYEYVESSQHSLYRRSGVRLDPGRFARSGGFDHDDHGGERREHRARGSDA